MVIVRVTSSAAVVADELADSVAAGVVLLLQPVARRAMLAVPTVSISHGFLIVRTCDSFVVRRLLCRRG